MDKPINWKDTYFFSKDRVVLTNNEIQIPGVRVLAHHLMSSAISPLAPHYHEHCFEFTVIYDGVFIFHAEEKNYKVTGGNIFVVRPDEVHSTDRTPLSHGDFYWFQLDVSSADSFLFLNKEAAEDLINRLYNLNTHVIKPDSDELIHFIRSAFRLATNAGNPYLTASYLLLFLNKLANISTNERLLSKDIYCSLNYIFDNIYSNISLEELAKCSNLSVPQFKVRFKQELGISPRSFINLQKIEASKPMLLEGFSKTEIALSLGFNTSSYFSAVFKKYTYCTPSEYVKRHKNNIKQLDFF